MTHKTMADHPITPSEKVIDEWESEWHDHGGKDTYEMFMAKQAARWGADQELEACCADIHTVYGKGQADWLRSLRRPKPPTLKEQALEALKHAPGPDYPNPITLLTADEHALIRRALNQLPNE